MYTSYKKLVLRKTQQRVEKLKVHQPLSDESYLLVYQKWNRTQEFVRFRKPLKSKQIVSFFLFIKFIV